MNKDKQRLINLSHWIIQAKYAYYVAPEGVRIPSDSLYDHVEGEYRSLCEKLSIEPTAGDMVGFDDDRLSCRLAKDVVDRDKKPDNKLLEEIKEKPVKKNKNRKHIYSYTKLNMFSSCPRKYDLHYNKYLRPTTIDSPLFFGNALDEALNVLLLRKKTNLTKEEKLEVKKDPYDVFDTTFENVKINYKDVEDFPTSPLANYSGSDVNFDLLNEEDFNEIYDFAKELEFDIDSEEKLYEFYEEVRPKKDDRRKLEEDCKMLFNLLAWLSLRGKGHLMIEAFERDIYSEIEEVFEVQPEINIPELDEEGNETGKILTGKIDYIAKFKNDDVEKRIMDNKTSSKRYKDDSVVTSEQLAMYCEGTLIDYAGYSVILKKPYKKDPIIRTQLILDKMPDEKIENTFDIISQILYDIDKGEFPENRDSCFEYGRPCPYYNYCRDNIETGLIWLYGKKEK